MKLILNALTKFIIGLLLVGTPLCFIPYVLVIIVRICNEKKVLDQGLDGYADYKKRVKYRFIPFIR